MSVMPVDFGKDEGKYAFIYSASGVSDYVMKRVADHPWGRLTVAVAFVVSFRDHARHLTGTRSVLPEHEIAVYRDRVTRRDRKNGA